jgi:hypothetical protein
MKNSIKILTIALVIFSAFAVTSSAFAQDPPPPPGGHGSENNQVPGGGAPIGGGALIVTLLATGYGLKKWHGERTKENL